MKQFVLSLCILLLGNRCIGVTDQSISKLFRTAFMGLGHSVNAEDAKQQLIAMGDRATPFLGRRLLDSPGEDAWNAAWLLDKIASDGAVALLMTGAERSPSRIARYRCIESLGELGCRGAIPVLTRLARGPLRVEAYLSASSLASIDAEMASNVALLRLAKYDPDWSPAAAGVRLRLLEIIRKLEQDHPRATTIDVLTRYSAAVGAKAARRDGQAYASVAREVASLLRDLKQ